MANHHAIGTISRSLVGVLKDARPPEFLGVDPGTHNAAVQLYQASDFANTPSSNLQLSVYLYRVAFNPGGRNRPFRIGTDGKRYRPALPLDLFYLLTAWCKTEPLLQHHLLAWAARRLDDYPVLPSSVLNHYGTPNSFSDEENVELTPEHLSQEQLVSVWEVNKPNQQPSLVYAARCVPIDSETELIEAGLVQSREFKTGTLEPIGGR
jgi:Pvc16 N-terminal domain